jgi:hypothetical protein
MLLPLGDLLWRQSRDRFLVQLAFLSPFGEEKPCIWSWTTVCHGVGPGGSGSTEVPGWSFAAARTKFVIACMGRRNRSTSATTYPAVTSLRIL